VALQAEKAFASLPPVIDQAIQLIQSQQPVMPPDPATQAAMADVQMRGQVEQGKAQLAAQKLQLDAQKMQADQQMAQMQSQMDMQLEQMREQNADSAKAAEIQAKIAMNNADNQTAKELAMMEIAHGANASNDLNPNPGP
jgi:hypothetical protein